MTKQTRLTISGWQDLKIFIKNNKHKSYVLRPIEIYGTRNNKKSPNEVKDIHAFVLAVEYEEDVNE